MLLQKTFLEVDSNESSRVKKDITSAKDNYFRSRKIEIVTQLPTTTARLVELACEKGSSSWLTTLPLEDYGFSLNKQEFQDALALRYGYNIRNIAQKCVCGEPNTIDHCLMCKRGGFVSLRHNSLRDTTAGLVEQVCKDVCIEPPLIPLTGETLPASSNTADEARLDISARSFWTPIYIPILYTCL